MSMDIRPPLITGQTLGEQVQQLIATLRSEAFKEKILALGGYTVENPGEVIEIQ